MDWTRLSKTLAHALRHDPAHYGLRLDSEGWVSLADLLAGLRGHALVWQDLEETHLRQVVSKGDKPRYEIQGENIRALHGHSVAQKIPQMPSPPPAKLYHGTKKALLAKIQKTGLQPMRRQYVHLSVDIHMAQQVAARGGGIIVILEVDAAAAAAAGHSFYRSNEAVWLADSVPPQFITPLDKD